MPEGLSRAGSPQIPTQTGPTSKLWPPHARISLLAVVFSYVSPSEWGMFAQLVLASERSSGTHVCLLYQQFYRQVPTRRGKYLTMKLQRVGTCALSNNPIRKVLWFMTKLFGTV